MILTEYKDIRPYTTKDGSIVCELMHPNIHRNIRQSLSEAIVMAGGITFPHEQLKR